MNREQRKPNKVVLLIPVLAVLTLALLALAGVGLTQARYLAVDSDRTGTVNGKLLTPIPEEASELGSPILAEEQQTVLLADWNVLETTSRTLSLPERVQEASCDSAWISAEVDPNSNLLTLTLTQAAQDLLAEQTEETEEPEGTDPSDSGDGDEPSGEGSEDGSEGTQDAESEVQEETPPAYEVLDGVLAEIHLECEDGRSADLELTLRTDTSSDSYSASMSLTDTMDTLEKGTWFGLEVPEAGQTYTVTVHNQDGDEVAGIRYRESLEDPVTVALESGSCTLTLEGTVLLMDFSYTTVEAGDDLTIFISDASGAVDVLIRTVAEESTLQPGILTQNSSLTYVVTDSSKVALSLEQLTLDEEGALTWSVVDLEETTQDEEGTQTHVWSEPGLEDSTDQTDQTGLTLQVQGYLLTVSLGEGSELAAGTYRITLSHVMGSAEFPWREVTLLLQYPGL